MDFTQLEWARRAVGRVELEESPGNWRVYGSGFLAGSGRILTALHVVVADRCASDLRPRGNFRVVLEESPIAANFEGLCDRDADWALLVMAPDPALDGREPLTLAAEVPLEEGGWWTCGFPELDSRKGISASFELRDPCRPHGRGTEILLHTEDLKGVPVHSLSGAPLFHGDSVRGILRTTYEERDRSVGYFTATPIQRVLGVVDLGSSRPNPYRALDPFTESQKDYFFGRGEETAAVIDRLKADSGSRMAILLGGSGSGKSSILQAGLVPRVRQNALATGDFEIRLFRPGPRPIEKLEGALDRWLAHPPPPGSLLLVADQLEELFNSEADPSQVREFLELICRAARLPGGRVWVAGAIRDGFMSDLLDLELDVETLRNALVPLGPIAREDTFVELIERPAAAVGMRFVPPSLSRTIAREAVREKKGALPPLQFALDRLWHLREPDGTLTETAYRSFGGVAGVMVAQAEKVAEAFPPADLRALFLQLVWIRADGPLTRRTLPYADLTPELRKLAFRLVDERLLVTTSTGVEIAHESLIGQWPRIQEWVQEFPENERFRQVLAAEFQTWVDGGRQAGDRLKGHWLDPVAFWARSHPREVPPSLRRFLVESLLGSSLLPERWANAELAPALEEAILETPPEEGRPPQEELRLLRAAFVASRSADLHDNGVLIVTARQKLEELVIRESRKAGTSPVKLAAGQMALEELGAGGLIALADRESSVRDLVALLLGEPEPRAQLAPKLPAAWSRKARRQAAWHIAWNERTSFVLVALVVLLSTNVVGRLWFAVDFLFDWAEMPRWSYKVFFGSVQLTILAALGAWLARWRRVDPEAPRSAEVFGRAAWAWVIWDLPTVLANLVHVAAGEQPKSYFIGVILAESLAAVLAYVAILQALAGAIETQVAEQGGLGSRKRICWVLTAVLLVHFGDLLFLGAWSGQVGKAIYIENLVQIVLSVLYDFVLICVAIAAAAWAARVASRPVLDEIPRFSRARIAGIAGFGILAIVAYAQVGHWLLVEFAGHPRELARKLREVGEDQFAAEVLSKSCTSDDQLDSCRDMTPREFGRLPLGSRQRVAQLGCEQGDRALCERWLDSIPENDERARKAARQVACEKAGWCAGPPEESR